MPASPKPIRVSVTEPGGTKRLFGWFLGLLLNDSGDVTAIVSVDNYGLFLKEYHPSRVNLTSDEEEEAYKP